MYIWFSIQQNQVALMEKHDSQYIVRYTWKRGSLAQAVFGAFHGFDQGGEFIEICKLLNLSKDDLRDANLILRYLLNRRFGKTVEQHEMTSDEMKKVRNFLKDANFYVKWKKDEADMVFPFVRTTRFETLILIDYWGVYGDDPIAARICDECGKPYLYSDGKKCCSLHCDEINQAKKKKRYEKYRNIRQYRNQKANAEKKRGNTLPMRVYLEWISEAQEMYKNESIATEDLPKSLNQLWDQKINEAIVKSLKKKFSGR